jgi:hypothetical protein
LSVSLTPSRPSRQREEGDGSGRRSCMPTRGTISPAAGGSWDDGASNAASHGRAWRAARGLAGTDGWARQPSHSTPETESLTEQPPGRMIGVPGLLRMVAWVEQRRIAGAASDEEGDPGCPCMPSSAFPPAHEQGGSQPVGATPSSESSAAASAPEPTAQAAADPARSAAGGQR